MTGPPLPLVGRAAELDALLSAYAAVVAGAGRLVLLSAEAGGGKTGLVGEFLARLPPGTPCGVGGAVDLGDQSSPLLPLRLVLADLNRNAGESPPAGALPLATAGGQDELIAELFERFSSEAAAGTVLVIEDVHWADATTLGVLRVVAGQLRAMAILLVITFRSDVERNHPVRAAIAELSRVAAATRIELAPLTRKDIGELYVRIVGEPADQVTLDQLQARTGGNPFFVNEAIASEADGEGEGSLPVSVHDGLVHRLEQLPTLVLDVVRVAAVTGRITLGQLADVSLIPTEAFADSVRAAVEANILVVDGEQVFFRHALLAEAVAQTMLSFETRGIHQRIAERIDRPESTESPETLEDLARLARHWNLAGRSEQALDAAWAAAEQAGNQRFFGVVLENLQVVLDTWVAVDGAAQRVGCSRNDVLLAASNAAAEVGRSEDSVRFARRAFEEAKVTDASRPEAAWRYAYALYAARDLTEAYRLISSEADSVIDSAPSPDVARLLVARVGMAMSIGDYRVGVDCDERVIAMVDELDDRQLDGWLASFRGVCVATTGDIAAGLCMLDEAVDLLVAAGDLGFAANARLNRITAGLSVDHIQTLLELAADGTELLSGAPASRRLALAGTYGELLHYAGRTSEAWALFQSGATRFVWRTAAERALALAAMALDAGDHESAQRLASSGDVAAAALNPPMALKAELLHCRLQATDAPDLAGRRLLDWMQTGSPVSVGIHGALALTYLWEWVSDESPWRAELIKASDRVLTQRSRTDRHSPAGVWLSLLDAGASGGDPQRWEAAIEACRAGGMGEALGRALLGAAGAYLGRGDRRAGSERLREAAAIAEATGAKALASVVQDLERRARLGVSANPENAFGLTNRETEVLRLVADGLTNKEIAEELFISAKTASVHVTNLIRKLQVGNRREAGRLARDLGLS